MKKYVVLTSLILFGMMVVPVLAAEEQQPGDLHGNVGYTYDTFHVWRGYLTYGHHSSSNPFINLDLFGTGFGFEAVGHYANGSGSNPDGLGYNNEQRWDYSINYGGIAAKDEPWETRYLVGYRYFNYPEMSARHSDQCIDLQEIFAGVAFPQVLGVPKLVPGFALVKGWPSMRNTAVGAANPNHGTYAGEAFIVTLDYGLPLENLSEEIPKQDLNFHFETVYNNHVDPRPGGGYTSSDWTHALFGMTTDFDLGNNWVFTPGLWHQITMEDDPLRGVSPDHSMTWCELTIKYKF